MRIFAHIIAESKQGFWSAWFRDTPQYVCDGHNCACAVAVLIDVYGSEDLNWQQIVTIDETAQEDHAEFLIPYANYRASSIAFSTN